MDAVAHRDHGEQQPTEPDPEFVRHVRRLREGFTRMQMEYQFAVDEVLTKVSILQREFEHLHRYNPIEHVSSRIKSLSSTLDKCLRRGIEMEPDAIRAGLTDIAGVRITCSFIADTYRILQTLTSQSDVRVLQIKDYIAHPKPNGYKSLHAIIEIPVFLSTGPLPVVCEVQIRTIAMDFWASLEHKIHYKYDGDVPSHLAASLKQAADVAEQLDQNMERLHQEVREHDLATANDAEQLTDSESQIYRILERRLRIAAQPATPAAAHQATIDTRAAE